MTYCGYSSIVLSEDIFNPDEFTHISISSENHFNADTIFTTYHVENSEMNTEELFFSYTFNVAGIYKNGQLQLLDSAALVEHDLMNLWK